MNRIFINKKGEKIEVFVYQNDTQTVVEQYEENFVQKRLEENIYLGKVKNIVKGMQSAFVDIGLEKNALIHIKDIIPKVSNVTGNNNLNLEQYDINKVIRENDDILVQIKKDCSDSKGSRITKDIKLVGKFVVLMPYSKFIAVSQKITDLNEKQRLIKIAKENLKNLYGAIIRTSAENVQEEMISKDIEELTEKWQDILNKKNEVSAPAKVYDNNGIIGKLINDFEPLGLEIYTNCNEVKNYIESIDKKIKTQIKQNELKIERPRKIWLKCGGFIIIDFTEALTSIDVNSGKFTGNKDLEKTVLKVNIEAANEIAKQLRLQDLGGIIVIDFIDMKTEENRQKVRKAVEEAIKGDRSKVQIMEFTKLGLLEITRKHILRK